MDGIAQAESGTYTIPEAAERFGISASHAYELARSGELPVPVIRFGRAMRVSRRAVDDIVGA